MSADTALCILDTTFKTIRRRVFIEPVVRLKLIPSWREKRFYGIFDFQEVNGERNAISLLIEPRLHFTRIRANTTSMRRALRIPRIQRRPTGERGVPLVHVRPLGLLAEPDFNRLPNRLDTHPLQLTK